MAIKLNKIIKKTWHAGAEIVKTVSSDRLHCGLVQSRGLACLASWMRKVFKNEEVGVKQGTSASVAFRGSEGFSL